MNSENGNFPVLLSKTVCSQNINKQIVNIADEYLTDYSYGFHFSGKNFHFGNLE